MLLSITIFFLALSLVFYILFGGADFGAGSLELLSGQQDQQLTGEAIGPVWEANHVWLILVIVILFMGFPEIYSVMSTYLHIPLLLMLIGIVFRGTAFAYMHYDAIKDQSNAIYNFVFKVSSLLTPVFLGMTVGALVLGRINPNAGSFYEAFIYPWFNLFSLAVGLFTLALFTFLAAVYLIGETDEPERRQAFISAARNTNIAVIVMGGLVFLTAEINGLPLLGLFLNSWLAMGAVVLATALLPLLWRSLNRSQVIWSRVLAATQVVVVLLAWFWVQFPTVINMGTEGLLTFYSAAAPESTLLQLVIALTVGSCIILPYLFYLMRTFKGKQFTAGE